MLRRSNHRRKSQIEYFSFFVLFILGGGIIIGSLLAIFTANRKGRIAGQKILQQTLVMNGTMVCDPNKACCPCEEKQKCCGCIVVPPVEDKPGPDDGSLKLAKRQKECCIRDKCTLWPRWAFVPLITVTLGTVIVTVAIIFCVNRIYINQKFRTYDVTNPMMSNMIELEPNGQIRQFLVPIEVVMTEEGLECTDYTTMTLDDIRMMEYYQRNPPSYKEIQKHQKKETKRNKRKNTDSRELEPAQSLQSITPSLPDYDATQGPRASNQIGLRFSRPTSIKMKPMQTVQTSTV